MKTARQMSHRSAGRSRSLGRQSGKPGWLATVVNLTGGTARRLVVTERTDRRPDRSITRKKGRIPFGTLLISQSRPLSPYRPMFSSVRYFIFAQF